MDTIKTVCPGCGTTFRQLNDPGRRAQYCGARCRQKAYRQRSGKDGNEARRQRQEQAAQQAREEQARREQAREESARERRNEQARERRRRARQQSYGTASDWWSPRTTDTAAKAKARATCARLMERAEHSKTNEHEAAACREKAETIRKKKGL